MVPGIHGKGGCRVTIFNKYYLGDKKKAAEECAVKGRGSNPGINNWYDIRCVCLYVSFFHSSAKELVTKGFLQRSSIKLYGVSYLSSQRLFATSLIPDLISRPTTTGSIEFSLKISVCMCFLQMYWAPFPLSGKCMSAYVLIVLLTRCNNCVIPTYFMVHARVGTLRPVNPHCS